MHAIQTAIATHGKDAMVKPFLIQMLDSAEKARESPYSHILDGNEVNTVLMSLGKGTASCGLDLKRLSSFLHSNFLCLDIKFMVYQVSL